MATIEDVKVWFNEHKTECRIYVHTADGREGVRYMTDTHWHKRGDVEGDLTAEEWKEARRLSVQDDKRWHPYVAPLAPATCAANARAALGIKNGAPETKVEEATATGFRKAKRGGYCALCGHFAEAGNDLVLDYDEIEDRQVWHVYHTDRSICEGYRAVAVAERERREALEARRQSFRALFQDAECPPEAEVDGETIYDTFSIYGAGSRIVIGEEWVWWIDRNGMDGDDWSRNNSQFGIAVRLPRTDDLVADARALAEEHKTIKSDN